MNFERTCQPGIVYGRIRGRDLTLDLYLPDLPADQPKPIPVVVYIHGGGWVQGSSGSPSSVAFALELAAEGLAVACINYRLAPQHPAPAAIEDAKLAVRWIRDNAPKYGLDARRVIAMGNSAGGHLALMLGLTTPQDGFDGGGLMHVPSSVMAVVDVCGITDVEDLLEAANARIWAQAWVPFGITQRAELARRCSPIQCARNMNERKPPPILILHGDADEEVPHEQSVRLDRTLKDVGADVELITIEGAGHMLGISGAASVQRQVRQARRAFFRRLGLLQS